MKSVIFSFPVIIIFSLVSLSKTTETKYITIELHHPDPSLSHYQRVANALQFQTTPVPTIQNTNGFYLVNYTIGTPPVTVQGAFDTGRDLIWTSCEKLMGKSSSLKNISCNSTMCQSFPERDLSCKTGTRCSYDVAYVDGSSNKGTLSTETITLGSVKLTNIAFGCETEESEGGSLGLGGGPVSLVRQLAAVGKIKPVFSYCLVSIDSDRSTSKLHLGDTAAVVSGKAIGLVPGSQTPTSYYVLLDSITVGDQKPMSFGKKVIVETGTMATLLPRAFYDSLVGVLKTKLGKRNVIKDLNFDLCYSKLPTVFPSIKLKFGTANVAWKRENVFAPVGPKLWCFAAKPIELVEGLDQEEPVLGSIGQVNFLVGFDLKANTVTFQPKDCSKSN